MNKTEQNRKFFDRWAKTYDWKPFQFWMKGFQQPILKEFTAVQKGTVLDIGCGTGELLQQLQQLNSRLELHGLDLSKEMLARAKEKLPSSIKLREGDVINIPFDDNTFDVVVSTEAFHHYPNQHKAMQEITRVAKHGGRIIIVDVNFFFRPIHWLFEKIEPGCVTINNKSQMRQLFVENGITNITQQRTFVFAVVTAGNKD